MTIDVRRAWKLLPEPVRRSANEAVQALGRAYVPIQVARRWRRGRSASEPIIVVGLPAAVLGLGQGARLFAEALRSSGFQIAVVDAGEPLSRRLGAKAPPDLKTLPSAGGVVVSHLNPMELERYLLKTGARVLKDRRHIGYWVWELPVAPPHWRRGFRYLDEVWCPSSFTAQALRAIAPDNVPIRVVPHPMFVTPEVCGDRLRFDLPPSACVVLQAFDLKSTAARKNPGGALQAYLAAVPKPGPSACLVCKVVGAEASPEIFAELQAQIATRPDLILIREELSGQDMLRLIASADIVLSLHRAEGFGLLLAEAMWLSKPVVATGWSGAMDFMDETSAALVKWTLSPARDPQGMYDTGALWAEPDIADAARKLSRLIADPLARAQLGAAARARAETCFSRGTWLETFKAALAGEQQVDRTHSHR